MAVANLTTTSKSVIGYVTLSQNLTDPQATASAVITDLAPGVIYNVVIIASKNECPQDNLDETDTNFYFMNSTAVAGGITVEPNRKVFLSLINSSRKSNIDLGRPVVLVPQGSKAVIACGLLQPLEPWPSAGSISKASNKIFLFTVVIIITKNFCL